MTKQEILKMLQHAEKEAVYSFISTHAESHEEFCKQLKTALLPGRKAELNKKAYQAKAESCFDFEGDGWRNRNYNLYQAACDAASELNQMLSDADYFIEEGEYAPAAEIAMSVAEVIPRNYETIDDSSGSLGHTFSMAAECLITLLRGEQVAKRLKEEIDEWVKQEMNNPVYSDYCFDDLIDVYDIACEEVGETDNVLADLDKQIETANDYLKESVVLRKIQFMQSRNLDTHDFIEKYLEMNAVRKIRFDQMMQSGLYNEALVLAERGIEIANTEKHTGTVSNWEESILELYLKQGDVKNILSQAEKLLLADYHDDDKYFQIIKKYTHPNDLNKTLERIIQSFETSPSFSHFLANLMVEQQMWQRLFTHCEKGCSIATTIEQYEQYLKPHFEKEILDIYYKYVEQKALISHYSAYDCVAHTLKRMRTFEGGNDIVDRLLQDYRKTYKRRKNMMLALSEV